MDKQLIESVGQLLLVGFEGQVFDAELEKLIEEIRPAGLVLFARNYPGTPEKLRELIWSVRDLTRALSGRELLVALDHEGGRVLRLPEPFTRLPSPEAVARDLTSAEAEALYNQAGRELAEVGFNLNLAPVLDLRDSADDFMGDRVFGSDPDIVAEYGTALLRGYRRAGILCCGKHFPGLGAARLDPHLELPTLTASRERFQQRELKPFRRLIADGLLGAVMSTHALYPAWDNDQPATFSRTLADLLRQDIGFAGPLFTDDLEMGGALTSRPLGQAVVDAVNAGHDLALVCRRYHYLRQAQAALLQALDSGFLSPERLTEAKGRVQTFSSRLPAAV